MVRPTKERGVVPFRVNAIFGWDPGEVGAIVDTTPPVDRVVDAVAEMPVEVLTELVQEAIGTRSTGAGTPTAVLGGAPTEGNTLIAIVGQRGSATTTGALSGFTKIGQAATDSFDGGVVAVYYREVAAPGETDTYAYTASSSANIYVAEFSGVGAFVDDATASAVAASASLAASGSVGTGDLMAFAAFAHAVRDGTGSGGVAPDYGWPIDWTREVNAGIDPSGPSVTMAWQQLTGHTPPLAVSGITATNSGTYGWLLATFEVTDRTWQQAPETQDDNDATYRAFDVSGAFWRTMLTEAFAVGTARAFIGFDTAGSRTVTLEGSEDGTFDDAVTLASATITATGSYTGDELAFTVATPGVYQFYRLVAAGAYDGRVYTVELYDYNPTGVDTTAIEADIDELQDDVAALEAAAGNYELNTEGGQSVIEDDSFPNAGATDDYDPTDGNIFARTLNANHVGTILAPVGSGGATLEWWIDTGAGGFTFELEADGGSVAGDISAHTLAAGQTFRVIAERIPGTTNDWVVDLVGGGGASALTIEDEGTPLATAASTLDFVGAGVTATGAGAEKTITIPGFTLTADALVALGVVGPILIADDHSTPIVFGDLLLTEDGDDFLYADLGG
jgi:hypothetical protein